MPEENWQLDEFETMRTILQYYQISLERMKRRDYARFVTREQFCQVAVPLIRCLDCVTSQNERLLDCVEQLTGSVIRLTNEVISLKNKIDEDDP